MGKHTDQVANTNDAIKKALMELINEKTFELITNKEVCEKAHVHRSTFRAHYDSLRDVLEDIKEGINESLFAAPNTESVRCKYIAMLTLVKEHQNYFMAYLSQNVSMLMPERVESAIYLACKQRIVPCICKNVDKEYAILMLRSGAKAAVYYWLQTGCAKSPEEVADYIFNFFGIPLDLVL